jgi:hypothetical protein
MLLQPSQQSAPDAFSLFVWIDGEAKEVQCVFFELKPHHPYCPSLVDSDCSQFLSGFQLLFYVRFGFQERAGRRDRSPEG